MIAKGLRAFTLVFLAVTAALNTAYAQADYANSAEVFSSKRAYEQAKLAPDGEHLALIARTDGKAGLLVFNIDTMQVVAALATEDQQDILRFWWANDERIIVNLELRNSQIDYPLLTGELYALNIDNTRKFPVAGFGAGDSANYEFLDAYSPDDKEILVIRSDIMNRRNVELDLSRPVAYSLDIYKRFRQSTGTQMKDKRLEKPYSSPYRTGGFVADNTGKLRLAYQIDEDNNLKLSERDYKEDEWVEYDFASPVVAAKQSKSNPVIGFDSNNTGVYFLGKSQFGTVGVFHANLESGETKAVYEHEQTDISKKDLILASDSEVLGVNVVGSRAAQFFNKTHPQAGKLRGLANAFKGQRVEVLNFSGKGEYALVDVIGPGSDSGLYLFETSNNSVSFLMPANS